MAYKGKQCSPSMTTANGTGTAGLLNSDQAEGYLGMKVGHLKELFGQLKYGLEGIKINHCGQIIELVCHIHPDPRNTSRGPFWRKSILTADDAQILYDEDFE